RGEIADEDPANVGPERALDGDAAHIAVDGATDHIGIHAAAADVFAHLIDDQQIDFLEGQEGHHLPRFLDEHVLHRLDFLAWQDRNLAGVVELILEDADAAQHRRITDDLPGDAANRLLIADPRRGHVHRVRALLLSEPDDGHLHDAAAESAAEVR